MNLRRMDLDCLCAPQRELEGKSFSKAVEMGRFGI